MPRRDELDLAKILASRNPPCPHCGRSITPEERTHIVTEHLECPHCRDLREHYEELPPHGQILVLSLPGDAVKPAADAISRRLSKFDGQSTPFVAVLIDLGGTQYLLSSADLGSIVSTMAAWVRGRIAPCAIVMTGTAAHELRKVLEITTLSGLGQLRVVDTRESGLTLIRAHLESRKPKVGYDPRRPN